MILCNKHALGIITIIVLKCIFTVYRLALNFLFLVKLQSSLVYVYLYCNDCWRGIGPLETLP